jgi:MoxR-like ATPase
MLVMPPVPERKGLTPAEVSAIAHQIIANVENVIVGKHDQVVLATAALLAEGHLIIEDVPGVAKTMLARAIARSTGCSFKRIQCTPDLQPADVLGAPYVDSQSGQTEFHFGPLFSQIVLADEINRANPRTQAALLEAMGEGTVSWERITYRLDRPFMVIATQNPIEQAGTFPLPEAQKDRFLIRLSLGYPSMADEREMWARFQHRHAIEALRSATTPELILKCQEAVREVPLDPDAFACALSIVHATREHPALRLGASPRASLGLLRMAQAVTAVQGKNSVTVEQVKSLAEIVLAHRLIVKPARQNRYLDGREVINEMIQGKKPD